MAWNGGRSYSAEDPHGALLQRHVDPGLFGHPRPALISGQGGATDVGYLHIDATGSTPLSASVGRLHQIAGCADFVSAAIDGAILGG